MQTSLNTLIDHTLLKPDSSQEDIQRLCEETIHYEFASACVLPVWAEYAYSLLKGKSRLCSVVGFPLGANTTQTKSAEARQLAEQGVDELDMVINISALKAKKFAFIEDEIHSVVKAAPNAIIKVIIETCILSDEEKRIAALLCVDGGAHFVKTSTGYAKAGATVEDVSILRKAVGPHFGVKASGGIRDKASALAMINAGASRIGTSGGVQIVLSK